MGPNEQPVTTVGVIEEIARDLDCRKYHPSYPAYFPRLIQFYYWMNGENICNGNKCKVGKPNMAFSCLEIGHLLFRSQFPFFVPNRPSVLLRPPKNSIFRIFILLRTNTDSSKEIIKAIIAVDIIFVVPVPNP